jgi:hypothetical protein
VSLETRAIRWVIKVSQRVVWRLVSQALEVSLMRWKRIGFRLMGARGVLLGFRGRMTWVSLLIVCEVGWMKRRNRHGRWRKARTASARISDKEQP